MRATAELDRQLGIEKISIHALRDEGDLGLLRGHRPLLSISIHALRDEGDRFIIASTVSLSIFLSTPSAMRATES